LEIGHKRGERVGEGVEEEKDEPGSEVVADACGGN